MGYPNGQIPSTALVALAGQPTRYLLPGPARAWEILRALVHARFGWWPTLNDAYRDASRQIVLFTARYQTTPTAYYQGRVDRRWWQGQWWYRRPGASAAAIPRTSNHGYGTAIDVADLGGYSSVRFVQFAAVAIECGWSNTEGRSVGEYWHWVFISPIAVDLVLARYHLDGTPIITTLPDPIEEDDMRATRAIQLPGTATVYLVVPLLGMRAADEAEVKDAGLPIEQVPADEWVWTLPRIGQPREVLRRPSDKAAFDWNGGVLEHITQGRWVELGRPSYRDLPTDNAVWDRPTVEG